MQADLLGATQNQGYSFRLLGGFSLLQGTFSCPLVPAANLGLDHARRLRCQPSLSLARLERSPARPEAERLGRSGGRASESTRSKHGGRTFAPQIQRGGLAESRGGLPLSHEDLEPRPWLLPAPQRGSRTKKMLLGCHQINDQTWVRPLDYPKSTEMFTEAATTAE